MKPNAPMHEAVCDGCGESFNPADPQDLEHVQTADGQPCGGAGRLTAEAS